MTDTRPNGFSFTANTHGTNVEVAVSVHSLFDDAPSDAEVDFANGLVVKLADAVAEYEPAEAVRNESLDAYVVLANTHQLLDLARDSVETTAPQARRYFAHAADNLEILKEWDPRFTTAYYQARKCEQAAGNFLSGQLAQASESLETWLPVRIGGDSPTPRAVVVDDRQTPESFAETRTPDHEAVSVRMVDAAELDKYLPAGRTVFPVPMFPDGMLESRLASSTYVLGMRIDFAVSTDREAFPLLKKLGEVVESHCSLTRGYTPVEYYTHLAYAKQLAYIAGSQRFVDDGIYRRNLIDQYAYSLSVLSEFDTEFVMPLFLARRAAELNEDMTSDEAIHITRTIGNWLPRDITDLIPQGWDADASAQLPEPLEAGLNALEGSRFVVVFDEQTAAEFEETGLPDRDKLVPVLLGEEVTERVFSLENVQIFLSDV